MICKMEWWFVYFVFFLKLYSLSDYYSSELSETEIEVFTNISNVLWNNYTHYDIDTV